MSGTCNTCHWWQPFAPMMSHDGKQFIIGHCSQARGLTADEYSCCQYKSLALFEDDAGPRPASEEAESGRT